MLNARQLSIFFAALSARHLKSDKHSSDNAFDMNYEAAVARTIMTKYWQHSGTELLKPILRLLALGVEYNKPGLEKLTIPLAQSNGGRCNQIAKVLSELSQELCLSCISCLVTPHNKSWVGRQRTRTIWIGKLILSNQKWVKTLFEEFSMNC